MNPRRLLPFVLVLTLVLSMGQLPALGLRSAMSPQVAPTIEHRSQPPLVTPLPGRSEDQQSLTATRSSSLQDWHIECVDCPKRFASSERSLQLDSFGHPHIAYGLDNLYYAWHDGTQWHYETVDNTFGVGLDASLALDATDRPHIAYYDTINADLKYAHWTGSAWDIQVVDSAGDVGRWPSLTLDTSGYPHISYLDTSNSAQKYAFWTGSAWSFQTVDDVGAVGYWGGPSSLVLDTSGNPHVSYIDYTNQTVKYAHWMGSAWISQTIDTVQSSIGHFLATSLALDATNKPHIAYSQAGGNPAGSYALLKYAAWSGSSWNMQSFSWGGSPSLRLDTSGNPSISYNDLTGGQYAHWTGTAWVIQPIGVSTGSLALDSAGNAHIASTDWSNLRYTQWTGNGWDTQLVDSSAGSMGQGTSLALDAHDQPHISYTGFASSTESLKYARWLSDTWTIQTIDPAYTTYDGCATSLALDASGFPHISYCSYPAGNVKYAHWTGSAWVTQTVSSGQDPSLALDEAGWPHISYQDSGLKYASWTGSAWNIQTVDSTGSAGGSSSLALDAFDQPHISYFDSNTSDVKYAHWTGSAWDIQVVDGNSRKPAALALDEAGRPHITYFTYYLGPYGNDLKYASWTGSVWETVAVAHNISFYYYNSLAVDSQGQPHIGYRSGNTMDDSDLQYAHRTGNTWDIQTVDYVADVGSDVALALDRAGRPHLSYRDRWYEQLKYARLLPPLLLDIVAEPSDGLHVGEPLTYTLILSGSGLTAQLWDPLPASVAYITGTVTSPAVYTPSARAIAWAGILPTDTAQIISFQVTSLVSAAGGLSLSAPIANTAWLTDTDYGRSTWATAIVNGWNAYLPLILRQF